MTQGSWVRQSDPLLIPQSAQCLQSLHQALYLRQQLLHQPFIPWPKTLSSDVIDFLQTLPQACPATLPTDLLHLLQGDPTASGM